MLQTEEVPDHSHEADQAESRVEQPRADAVEDPGQPPIRFDREAHSAEALAFVDDLVAQIEQHEQGHGCRQRARSDRWRKSFVKAVGGLAGALAVSADEGGRPPVPCPKDRNAFSRLPVTYLAFKAAYDALLGLGLVEMVSRGSYRRWTLPGSRLGRGKTERIRATPRFVELVRQHGISDADEHFPQTGKPNPIELRAASARLAGYKFRGGAMALPANRTTKRLQAEVGELNDFIGGVAVEGAKLTGWTRIFNEGDRPDFNWNRGGRLYARPRGSYQALSKEERSRLRLDGAPVVEIDIAASYLTVLYAIHGQRLDSRRDPYEVGDLPRGLVKRWMVMTLGYGQFHEKWPPKVKEELAEEGHATRRYPIRTVRAEIIAAHPVLAGWGKDNAVRWSGLMFRESQAVVATMLRLKREHSAPCLPVHDSLIVPRRHHALACEALSEEYRRAVGVEPRLKWDDGPQEEP